MQKAGLLCLSVALVLFLFGPVTAQTTAFTYQGSLKDGANPANGNYDFQFKLFDLVSGGTQQGITLQRLNVAVANGLFNVSLDFGAAVLTGADRFLDISIRTAGGGAFTTLAPRQLLSSSPYSVRSLNSQTAADSTQLGGVAANQYVLTADPRMSDSRPPTAGSNNYIQNQSAGPQAASSFNISGSAIVGGSSLSIGNSSTSGRLFLNRSTVIGANSSDVNFGSASGADFSLGTSQGSAPATDFSLYNYGTGSNVLTVQRSTGRIGFGTVSPAYPFHFVRSIANTFAMHVQTNGLSQGQSYGLVVSAGTSNDTPFWVRSQDGASSFFRVKGDGGVGIGTDNPTASLEISRNYVSSTALSIENTSSGSSRRLFLSNYGTNGGGIYWSGLDSANTSSLYAPNPLILRSTGGMIFSGSSAAEHMRVTTNGNLGIGSGETFYKLHVLNNNPGFPAGFFQNANLSSGQSFGVLIAAGTTATDYAFQVQSQGNIPYLRIGGDGFAHFYGSQGAQFEGAVTANQLVVAHIFNNGSLATCWAGNLIASCSSSLRYKTNIGSYDSGLDLVQKFRPITFDWKRDGMHDVGLAAEDVEKIDPLLVTYNDKAQVEGVKYDRIGVVLINAIKEQQAQIAALQKTNAEQQGMNNELRKQVDALKTVMCSIKPDPEICKTKDK